MVNHGERNKMSGLKTEYNEAKEKLIKETKSRTTSQNLMIAFLAVLGACSVLIEIVTPLFLVFFWVKLFGFTGFGSYLMYIIGILATVYRIIHIGFLK